MGSSAQHQLCYCTTTEHLDRRGKTLQANNLDLFIDHIYLFMPASSTFPNHTFYYLEIQPEICCQVEKTTLR